MKKRNTLTYISLFILAVSFCPLAQNLKEKAGNKSSLTEILNVLSHKYKVYINFNPGVADRIYLDQSAVHEEIGTLNGLLVDYDLEIKRASRDYLYVKPLRRIELSGQVLDAGSGSLLPNIPVQINGTISTCTDSLGNFSFLLHKDDYRVSINQGGFYPRQMKLVLTKPAFVRIDLKKIKPISKKRKKKLSEILVASKLDYGLQKMPHLPDSFPVLIPNIPSHLFTLPDSISNFALKTDLVLWCLESPNLILERKLSRHFSASFLLALNTEEDHKRDGVISYVFQPELRYWFSQSFQGGVIGIHPFYASKGVEKRIFPFDKDIADQIRNNRYDLENIYGAGISLGYQWPITKHWHFETVLGMDYLHYSYKNSWWNTCRKELKNRNDQTWGISKLQVNLVYVL